MFIYKKGMNIPDIYKISEYSIRGGFIWFISAKVLLVHHTWSEKMFPDPILVFFWCNFVFEKSPFTFLERISDLPKTNCVQRRGVEAGLVQNFCRGELDHRFPNYLPDKDPYFEPCVKKCDDGKEKGK